MPVYLLLIMPSTMSIAHTSIHPPDNSFKNEYTIRSRYTGISYTHFWRHYQEDVYWYELYSLLKALWGGCILVWVMLIVEGIIRRMYTGMNYTHCWRYYEEDVYWYELCSLLKALTGRCILVWCILIFKGIIRRMYTGMCYAHCWWHYQE
jgi:uncharacterized membrane protein YeaQ/YmgE (transglycosylase-associated protein family)